MRKQLQHITILLIALSVFFTGMGTTVLNYCCSSCISNVISSGESHSCCVQYDVDKLHRELACESDHEISIKDSACSSSRLSADLDYTIYKPSISAPFVWLSNIVLGTDALALSFHKSQIESDIQPNSPPTISPRAYLSLIRVLII